MRETFRPLKRETAPEHPDHAAESFLDTLFDLPPDQGAASLLENPEKENVVSLLLDRLDEQLRAIASCAEGDAAIHDQWKAINEIHALFDSTQLAGQFPGMTQRIEKVITGILGTDFQIYDRSKAHVISSLLNVADDIQPSVQEQLYEHAPNVLALHPDVFTSYTADNKKERILNAREIDLRLLLSNKEEWPMLSIDECVQLCIDRQSPRSAIYLCSEDIPPETLLQYPELADSLVWEMNFFSDVPAMQTGIFELAIEHAPLTILTEPSRDVYRLFADEQVGPVTEVLDRLIAAVGTSVPVGEHHNGLVWNLLVQGVDIRFEHFLYSVVHECPDQINIIDFVDQFSGTADARLWDALLQRPDIVYELGRKVIKAHSLNDLLEKIPPSSAQNDQLYQLLSDHAPHLAVTHHEHLEAYDAEAIADRYVEHVYAERLSAFTVASELSQMVESSPAVCRQIIDSLITDARWPRMHLVALFMRMNGGYVSRSWDHYDAETQLSIGLYYAHDNISHSSKALEKYFDTKVLPENNSRALWEAFLGSADGFEICKTFFFKFNSHTFEERLKMLFAHEAASSQREVLLELLPRVRNEKVDMYQLLLDDIYQDAQPWSDEQRQCVYDAVNISHIVAMGVSTPEQRDMMMDKGFVLFALEANERMKGEKNDQLTQVSESAQAMEVDTARDAEFVHALYEYHVLGNIEGVGLTLQPDSLEKEFTALRHRLRADLLTGELDVPAVIASPIQQYALMIETRYSRAEFSSGDRFDFVVQLQRYQESTAEPMHPTFQPSEIVAVTRVKNVFTTHTEQFISRMTTLQEAIGSGVKIADADNGFADLVTRARKKIEQKKAQLNEHILVSEGEKKRGLEQQLHQYEQIDLETLAAPEELFANMRSSRFFEEELLECVFALCARENRVAFSDDAITTSPEEMTRGDIERMTNLVDHIVRQEFFGKVFTSTQAKRELRRLLNMTALNEEWARMDITRTKEKVEMQFIPSRDLKTELSGAIADGCWNGEYDSILEKFPNLTSVTIVRKPGTEHERLAGNFLTLSSTKADGTPVLILRGINPLQSVIEQLSAADFLMQVIEYMQPIAEKQGCDLAIVMDDHVGGSGTNRQSLYAEYAQLRSVIEPIHLQSPDDTTFNQYDITGDCYAVEDIFSHLQRRIAKEIKNTQP
jgi:hypothetical protein